MNTNNPNRNFQNQNNLIDLISQQVTNNILQILNNNYSHFYNNNIPQVNSLQNINVNTNLNNNKDIFNTKNNNKILEKSKQKDNNLIKQNALLDRQQFSLNKRKENINRFLMNYRYKNSNNKDKEKIEKFIEFSNNNSDKNNILNNDIPKQIFEQEQSKFTLLNEKNNEVFKSDIILNNSNNNQLQEVKNSGNLRVNNKEKDAEILIKLGNKEKDEEFFKIDSDTFQQSIQDLKKLFIDEIFYQKFAAKNYEIPFKLFKEIKIPDDGNCFYRCFSYYFYKNVNRHLEIRETTFQYIVEHAEEFYMFFEGNDNIMLNNFSPKSLLEEYVLEHNNDGKFAGDLEYSAICKLFNMQIFLLIRGYEGFNVFNIFNEDNIKDDNVKKIYILYVNKNHFNYLEIQNEDNSDLKHQQDLISKCINNNLLEWKNIRKQEYPLSLKWYPEIYREMYCFYKYNIIPEERFSLTSNPRVYINRFKELAQKSFYYENDRLYYIKKSETERLSNGNFVDINKVILKKIPYTYEIIPLLDNIHKNNGHISFRTLSKKFLEEEFYIDSIDTITKEYTNQCPECYAKFYSKKLVKKPKMIYDEGPHYRLLVDITYLDSKYYSDKTNYKYIIDCIDHFSKFYWAYLIRNKTAETALNKIKNFIAINKKPVIIQTDNGLEFKNKLV